MSKPFKSYKSIMLCLCCWFFPKWWFDTLSTSACQCPCIWHLVLAVTWKSSLQPPMLLSPLFTDDWTLGLRDGGECERPGYLTKEITA